MDGVIASGTVAIPAAAEAFKRLVDEQGDMQVPVIFITNSLSKKVDRANQLSGFLGVKVCAANDTTLSRHKTNSATSSVANKKKSFLSYSLKLHSTPRTCD